MWERSYIYVCISCMQYMTEQNFNRDENLRMSGEKYQSLTAEK